MDEPFKRGDVVEDTTDGSLYVLSGPAILENYFNVYATVFERAPWPVPPGGWQLPASKLKLIGHIEVPDEAVQEG